MPKNKPRWRDNSDDARFYVQPDPQPRPKKRRPLMAPLEWHIDNSEDQPRQNPRQVILQIMRADPDLPLKKLMRELEARGVEISETTAGDIRYRIARGR